MRDFRLIVFICAAFVLQVTVLRFINIVNIVPNVLLVTAVFISYSLSRRTALIYAAFCGFLADAMGVQAPGLHIFLFLVLAIVVQGTKKYFFSEDNNLVLFAVVFGASITYAVLYCIVRAVVLGMPYQGYCFSLTLLTGIYNVICAPLVYLVFKKCVLKSSM